MTAAIAAARSGAAVTILEHTDRLGKKILSTGNGRCNLTNLKMDETCFRSSDPALPMQVIKRFSEKETLEFFHQLGIMTKSKNGYIYPNSEQASAVLDTLVMELENRQVRVVTDCEVRTVTKRNGEFQVQTSKGQFRTDTLILATGSKAAPATGSDGSGYALAQSFGHRLIKPLPALVQLRCNGKYFKQLAGVRVEARVTLESEHKVLASDLGEVQLTDYGISGIPTFQVSRYAAAALDEGKKVFAMLDFLPYMTDAEVADMIRNRQTSLGYRPAEEFLTGVIHKKLAVVLYKIAEISLSAQTSVVSEKKIDKLCSLLKHFAVEVTATNSFEQAQICCGGIATDEIDPETMESRREPGLYLVGELLDVDGICGGYNLQWAWSTGMIAGTHAAAFSGKNG
jgi:hypothetical protein